MTTISRTFLVLTTVVFSLLMIPMGMATIMSPMAFDSGKSFAAWVLVGAVCSFIPLTLTSILASWIIHRRRSYKVAIGVSLLPLIDILILAAIFAAGSRYSLQ